MRIAKLLVAALMSVLAVTTFAAVSKPTSEEQKTLYAIGLAISRNLGTFNLSKADLEMVKAGLTDGVLGNKPKVDIQAYGPKIQELQHKRLAAVAQREKAAGQAYLKKVSSQKGARKTDSGMVFIPLKDGSGTSPKATDTVKVHYEGKLIDGKVFDSSVKRGQPATFALNQVIPCWTEGMQLVKVGGKARLICPSDVAYGDQGHPPVIPPGATLVFEVELLDIVK